MTHDCRERPKTRPDFPAMLVGQPSCYQALDGGVDLEWRQVHLLGESGIGHALTLERNELQRHRQILRLEHPLTGIGSAEGCCSSRRCTHMQYAYSIYGAGREAGNWLVPAGRQRGRSGGLREICGNQSCSVVLSRDDRNGRPTANLLKLTVILSAASSS